MLPRLNVHFVVGLWLFLLIRAGAIDDLPLVRSWQTEDGLPSNTVRAVMQTRDGFLWVATDAGLARFDGRRFSTFGVREGLPLARLRCLMASRDGSLWMGFIGNGVGRLHEGKFTFLT